MKEVDLKRYAGPFESIPFEQYIHSPIGLVPKDGGKDTRLIFHLSYPRNSGKNAKSINASTPHELCTVKYKDFDQAIKRCLEEGEACHISKSDMISAFRNLGVLHKHWNYLIMKARNPKNGKMYFFVDKCLPFSASISCAHFQSFSDAIAHIVKWRVGLNKEVINYLDDFLFIALMKWLCDHQMAVFMEVCVEINFPISLEKKFWGTTQLVFLGLLIDTVSQVIYLPIEKIEKGRNLV